MTNESSHRLPVNRGQTDAQPLRIGFVLTPGMLATGTALPYEMWLAALDVRRAAGAPRACELLLVESVKGAEGRLALRADCSVQECPALDLIYLPALWRNPLAVGRRLGDGLFEWLRRSAADGALIAAVSTGVSLLAAAGLLDGRAATTHWYFFDRFEKVYPAVELKRQFFITQSGGLYCAASINSLADVTVHLIERFLDRRTAQQVERNFSHEIRRTYEEYRYLDGGSSSLHDEMVVEAQMWIAANPASGLSVDALATHLGVARRTLERRFRAATGSSVRRYWQGQRMRLSKELLETTNLSIGDIAWRVGYQDAGYFARLFQREMSVTPFEYRQTVRAKLFRADASSAFVNNFND